MKAICFIDDQKDERERVQRFLGDRFRLGVGATLEDALTDLNERGAEKPDAFLVDMYFPDGPTDTTSPFTELNKARSQLLKAETKFYEVLAKLRQSPEGGFKEARKARRRFNVPVVFFTRKGTIDNAIRAYEEENAASVIKKPDPSPKEATSASTEELPALYDKAFGENSAYIGSKLEEVIHEFKWYVKYRSTIYGFLSGFVSSALVAWLMC